MLPDQGGVPGQDEETVNTNAHGDAGMVTVEAAIGLSAVFVAFVLVLGGVAAVIGQLRCTDAAVEAARLVARGDQERASEVVTTIAPNGARLELTVTGGNVTTNVSAPLPGGFFPGRVLSAQAFAVLEPGVPAQGGPQEEAAGDTGSAETEP